MSDVKQEAIEALSAEVRSQYLEIERLSAELERIEELEAENERLRAVLETQRKNDQNFKNAYYDRAVKAEAEVERLRAALREGLQVADDLIEKTDVYLGINDAYARHEKWEKCARAALQETDDD